VLFKEIVDEDVKNNMKERLLNVVVVAQF